APPGAERLAEPGRRRHAAHRGCRAGGRHVARPAKAFPPPPGSRGRGCSRRSYAERLRSIRPGVARPRGDPRQEKGGRPERPTRRLTETRPPPGSLRRTPEVPTPHERDPLPAPPAAEAGSEPPNRKVPTHTCSSHSGRCGSWQPYR